MAVAAGRCGPGAVLTVPSGPPQGGVAPASNCRALTGGPLRQFARGYLQGRAGRRPGKRSGPRRMLRLNSKVKTKNKSPHYSVVAT